jgi:hypothetical protein
MKYVFSYDRSSRNTIIRDDQQIVAAIKPISPERRMLISHIDKFLNDNSKKLPLAISANIELDLLQESDSSSQPAVTYRLVGHVPGFTMQPFSIDGFCIIYNKTTVIWASELILAMQLFEAIQTVDIDVHFNYMKFRSNPGD